jgi:hypothetical protein
VDTPAGVVRMPPDPVTWHRGLSDDEEHPEDQRGIWVPPLGESSVELRKEFSE